MTAHVLAFDPATHGTTLDDVCRWLETSRPTVQAALRVGGVLAFRGFPLASAADFERFAVAIDPDARDYHGQTVRARVHGRVYESTPIPGPFSIPMHSETSYASYFPSRGFFYCAVAARRGGETLFVDNRAVLAAIPEDVVRAFRARGIRYIRTLPPASALPVRVNDALRLGVFKSWQAAFDATVREDVDAFCAANGLPHAWEGDWLSLSATLPAIRRDDQGHEVWFNQAHLFHVSRRTHSAVAAGLNRLLNAACGRTLLGATFGDGGALDDDTMVGIKGITERLAWRWSWQAGDVLFFDNLRVAHGRAPFRGKRSLLTLWTGYRTGSAGTVKAA